MAKLDQVKYNGDLKFKGKLSDDGWIEARGEDSWVKLRDWQ